MRNKTLSNVWRPIKSLLFTVFVLAGIASTAQVSTTFNATSTFTPPAGITQVMVECWGGGGRGGTRTTNGQGGGGGGGAYSRMMVPVVPGTPYTVNVGAGSTSTAPGGDSWFSTATTVMAKGGNSANDNSTTGATGGTAAASIGTVKFGGGNGANGGTAVSGFFQFGGGGGSSAGNAAVGANGSSQNAGTAPTGGGNGGAGNSGFGGQGSGTAGSTPGGGGGGARRTSGTQAGGNGANGRVVVSYYQMGTCMSTVNVFNSIPDNGCGVNNNVTIPLPVSTTGTLGTDVFVTGVDVIVSHAWGSDVRMYLRAPDNTQVALINSARGGTGTQFGDATACPNGLFRFASSGAALSGVVANSTNVGTWIPDQPLSNFHNGSSSAGTWSLVVCDAAAQDLGAVRFARVNLCRTPQATITPVDDCPGQQFNVQIDVTDLGTSSSLALNYTVDGAPFSIPSIGAGITTIGPFPILSSVSCTLTPNQAGCGTIQATVQSACTKILNCVVPDVVNYCYRNNDQRSFTFQTPTPGETVTLNFIQGALDLGDVVNFYDGPNDLSPSLGGGNFFGNLAGQTFTSTGPTLHMKIQSNSSNSCADGGQTTPWQFEAKCTPGCQAPVAIVDVTNNCAAYTFSMDVTILSVGDGTSTDLVYTVNGGTPAFVNNLLDFDLAQIGPFTVGDQVNLTLLHSSDPLCNANLGSFTNTVSCPSAENCVNALNLGSQTSPLSGTTVGRVNDFSIACGTTASNTAPDAIYYIDVPNGAQLDIRQQSNTYDSQHYVRYGGACPGTTVIACINDEGGEVAWVNWTNTTGSTQRVWWIQDGRGTASGNFVLQWQLTTCPVAPPAPTMGVSSYSICRNGTVPGGQGLTATCANVTQSVTYAFPVGSLISEGTTPTTRATVTVAPLPAGAVITGAQLNLTGVVANTSLFGNAQRQNLRVALAGAYTLATTQVTTATGPGTVTPNPVITLAGFPTTGGSIDLRTWQTTDQLWTNPDVNIATASITINYHVPTTPRWYSANISGTLLQTGNLFNPVATGAVNASVVGTSTFYATCGYAACENIRMPATFSVTAPPNAGTSGNLVICAGSTVTAPQLFASLVGTPNPGGSWSPALAGAGTYTYTVNATAPCTGNASATVTVTTQAPPSAGTNGNLVICAGSTVSASQLLAALGGTPDGGGSWSPALAGAGTYTYTVNATAPCTTPATAQVVVSEQDQPNAGTNGTLTICINATSVDLATSLGGTPDGGGGWTFEGNPHSGIFVPGADLAGVYTYTVNAIAPCTGNVSATVTVNYNNTDTDGDAIIDCLDNCPTVLGVIGSTCDANPSPFGFTLGQLNGSCTCVAVPCTETVTLELRTDLNSQQASWEILDQNLNFVVCGGGGYPPNINTPITDNCCLPVGCYRLRVMDSGGDGFVTGGYQLRESGVSGRRIIDNLGNFNAGSVSGMAANIDNGAFCVPIGNDLPIFTSCDKLDWVNNQFMMASENAAVSAMHGVSNANSGYEFWFFDPNGSYSYRRFRSHASSDGFGTGATRACHFKLNGWMNTILNPHIPQNVLLNVRIRGRVNGLNQPFGPACLFKMDAVRAACPLVKLQDNPANPSDFSCGVNRTFGGGAGSTNRIVANPPQFQPANVPSGNVRYQFRFRIPGEIPNPGSCIVRPPQTSPTLMLNWTTGDRLKCNTTYEVDVRVSKDGGATWCVDVASPACSGAGYTPWGKVCSVNITTSTFCPGPLQGGSSSMAVQGNGTFTMYPNPNRGDQLFLNVSEVERDVNTVTVDLFDMTGKRVMARTIAVTDNMINTTMELNGDLAGGLYLVNITAGTKTYTERLVIQP